MRARARGGGFGVGGRGGVSPGRSLRQPRLAVGHKLNGARKRVAGGRGCSQGPRCAPRARLRACRAEPAGPMAGSLARLTTWPGRGGPGRSGYVDAAARSGAKRQTGGAQQASREDEERSPGVVGRLGTRLRTKGIWTGAESGVAMCARAGQTINCKHILLHQSLRDFLTTGNKGPGCGELRTKLM